MKLEKKKLNYYQIKMFCEFLADLYMKEGISAKFSYMAVKNLAILQETYRTVMTGFWDERSDSSVVEYNNKYQQIVTQYADRDPQSGKIIMGNDGNPVITEQIVEFQKEIESLNNQYKSLMEIVAQRREQNKNHLKQEMEVEFYTLDVSEIPDKISPMILEICVSND